MKILMKSFFVTVIGILTLSICNVCFAQDFHTESNETLQYIEKKSDGKIGVYAIDTNNNQIIAYRADEQFPVQSTFKLIAVSALLKQLKNEKELNKEIQFSQNDLVFWHPVTGQYVNRKISFKTLSEAAISYSDNSAANLITKKLGGPHSITDFAHSIGNQSFNLENYESNLNSNPNINQDSSTPKDMAESVQKLILGNVLTQSQRNQLVEWMRNNAVGYKRMRAGVSLGWVVADKTGSGDYGIANDIGIVWSPTCKPIVLAIYTVHTNKTAAARDDIVASITSTILDEFAKHNSCFKKLLS